MRERKTKRRQLELAFFRSFLRLSSTERQRLTEELARPFRRQWFVVDAHGVRRLEE